MGRLAECPECGNSRGLFGECEHCGSLSSPFITTDTVELNIKLGNPTVEEALDDLSQRLREFQAIGIRAVVLIHGYGSSGEGGRIKKAVHDALENNRYADRVEEYFFGESVPFSSATYHALVKQRPGLKRYLKHFKAANAGMTILFLGSSQRNA